MELAEVMSRRRSVRAYESRPVEPEKIRAVLEAADAAPSAGNLQAFEIVRVTDGKTRGTLARAALGQDFVAAAPVSLVFFASPGRATGRYGARGRDLYSVQDATIACTYAMLKATDLGLATVWVGAFDDAAVSKAVRAPKDLRPVAVLPIGYPAESPGATPRRGIGDLVRDESF